MKFTILDNLLLFNPNLIKLYQLRSILIAMFIIALLSLVMFYKAKYFVTPLSLAIFLMSLVFICCVVTINATYLGVHNIPVAYLDFQLGLNVEFDNNQKYFYLLTHFPDTYITLSYGTYLLLKKDPEKKHKIWELLKSDNQSNS